MTEPESTRGGRRWGIAAPAVDSAAMGKTLKFAAAALTLVLLLILGLGFKGWDATEFASEALARFETEAGWKLEAESARLVPFEGLVLEGVTGSTRLGGGQAEIVVEQVILEHRPIALLSGELSLERLVLVNPRVSLSEPPPPAPRTEPVTQPPAPAKPRAVSPPTPPEHEPEPIYDGPVRFELKSVEIRGGTLVVAQAGADTGLRVEGLELLLDGPSVAPEQRRSLARALTSTGTFRAESIELPVGTLSGVEGDLRIEHGRLLLPSISFSNGLGDFTADVDLQLGSSPLRYAVMLHAEPFDLHALFDSPERGLFGSAELDIRVNGIGTSREALTGKGSLSVAKGRLPSFPILNHLEAGLRRVSLHQADHGPVLASFTLADGRLELEPFSITAGELRFAGEGFVGLDGELDLGITLSALPGTVSLRGVPADLVRLMTVEGGRLSIPVLVTGNTERPRASVDSSLLVQRAHARGELIDEAALNLQLDRAPIGLDPPRLRRPGAPSAAPDASKGPQPFRRASGTTSDCP